VIVVKGGEKHLLLHRCASFVAKIRTKGNLLLIFPAGKASPGETPQELVTRRLTDRPRKASVCNRNLL